MIEMWTPCGEMWLQGLIFLYAPHLLRVICSLGNNNNCSFKAAGKTLKEWSCTF